MSVYLFIIINLKMTKRKLLAIIVSHYVEIVVFLSGGFIDDLQ